MPNAALTIDEALAVILAHLRTRGRATNSELRDLLGGDEALFARVHERLIFDALAQDKGGKGLIYTGPPAERQEQPEPGTTRPVAPLRIFLMRMVDVRVAERARPAGKS